MISYPCKYGHGDVGYMANGQCRECNRQRSEAFRLKDPERARRLKNINQNARLYGRDYDRDAQLDSQGNACAICGKTGLKWGKGFNNVWHTDHVHGKEGTHRGVLCGTCNTALGRLEPFMDKVIAYLAKYADEQRAIKK